MTTKPPSVYQFPVRRTNAPDTNITRSVSHKTGTGMAINLFERPPQAGPFALLIYASYHSVAAGFNRQSG
jgi:hypothetical protein